MSGGGGLGCVRVSVGGGWLGCVKVSMGCGGLQCVRVRGPAGSWGGDGGRLVEMDGGTGQTLR